jgi:hypothetical protein
MPTSELRRVISATVAFSWLAGISPQASADPDPRRASVDLYAEAKRLEEAGRYDLACEKLEDLTVNLPGKVGPELELAACYEAQGRLATAEIAYETTVRLAVAANDDRAEFARMKAAALARHVPKLRILVPESARDLPGLRVERDGVLIDPSLWGTDVPTDPGPHVLSIEAKGKIAHKKSVDLEAKDAITSIKLDRPGDAVSDDDIDKKHGDGPNLPTLPLLAGGTGILLLGVATGFGLDALAAKSTLSKECYGDYTCPKGVDPTSGNGRKDRGFGILLGAGAAGVALIGVGIVGLTKSRKATPKTKPATTSMAIAPLIMTDGGGLLVEGFAW